MSTYSATVYHNYADPHVDASNMNHLETGIQTAHSELETLKTASVGVILPFPTSGAITGWKKCDNTPLSRTGIGAALFALISTSYGTGDGSTTFNVPDLRGLFVRARDDRTAAGGAVDPYYSENSNTIRPVGSYQADRNKQHEHPLSYQQSDPSYAPIQRPGSWSGDTLAQSVNHNGDYAVNSTGTEFRPQNYAVCYYIKL